MKNRNLIISLCLGLASAGLAFYLLYRSTSEIEKKVTPVQVLVASKYIPAGVFLNPNMVEKKSIPESFISPSTIRELREVEGLMTLVPLSEGEQILSNKFGESEESLAFTLNPGYRAYTLEVNETNGVGGLIHPGNHIDLLTKIESGKREITSFVYQNLLVLAVGQKLSSGQQGAKGSDSSRETDSGYGTVTLAVTPEEAETLMYLEGRPLRLILRGSNDEEVVSIPAQTESEILSKLGHFSPSSGRKLEIIRGESRQGN